MSPTASSIPPVIAIDGPAASGKSTVARRVAAALGFDFVSTGEMYRAVAWLVLKERGKSSRETPVAAEEVVRLLDAHPPSAAFEDGVCVIKLGRHDPMPHLHDGDVAGLVSEVARIAEVRQKLVAVQRELARCRGVVMEGRDIGTVVFPDTPFKFFIDADPEIRAARRQAQGRRDSVAERDRKDSSRPVSPLLAAPDAVRIDSSSLGIDEVTALILSSLAARGLSAEPSARPGENQGKVNG